MKLNLVKARRKFNYFKNLSQYLMINVYAFIKSFYCKVEIEYKVLRNSVCKEKNIVLLGEIDEKRFFEGSMFSKSINEIAEYPDLVLYYSDANINDFPDNNISFHNVKKEKFTVIDLNGLKIGCTLFDLDSFNSFLHFKCYLLCSQWLFRRKNTDCLIAYVKGTIKNTREIGKIKKLIGTWGFDFVVGISNRIKGKRNYRTLKFKETRVLYSLGKMSFSQKRMTDSKRDIFYKPGIVYKFSISKKDERAIFMKEGYFPLILAGDKKNIQEIKEIRKDLWKNEVEKKYYLYLERKMRGFRNWREMITLKDVFFILQEKIPPQYKYLENCSVNQICARTYELSPGNVFFFRRAFKDKNDLKTEKEFTRNKLVLRAFTRKALFVFSYKKIPSIIPHAVIKDPTEAHIKLMAWYKRKFIKAKYIGVTGSVGKTSTKDMLYYVLKEGYKTERNYRNSNVQVKIGINEQRISSDTEIYVQEIGGGRPGGASRHSRMVLPDVSVITNIGTAHIGNYESQEDLRDNKMGIVDGMSEDGMLFLNGDDDLLNGISTRCRITYFALHNRNADYFAENIREMGNSTAFDIVSKEGRFSARINVLGEYNVLNAICSFAVAKYFGMKEENIISGLKNFKTTGIRQNYIKVGGLRFFVDCYNASLSSIDSSLSVLTKFEIKKGYKRIAIIGDVTGMGELIDQINEEIARVVSKYDIEKTILYGKNAAQIGSLVKKDSGELICIEKREKLEKWMSENIKRGDIVLVKGSSKVKLDEILDSVFGFNLADQRYIDEAHYSTFRRRNEVYKIFEEYASLNNYNGKKNNFRIPNRISHKRVTKIVKKACRNNLFLRKITIGENVVHIGSFAFENCKNLEEVEVKGELKFIGEGAFRNCSRLRKVTLNDNIIHIGSKAFENCKSLEGVFLSKATGYIGKNAFKGSKINIKHI